MLRQPTEGNGETDATSAAARLSYAGERHEPASEQHKRHGFRDVGGERGERGEALRSR